MLNIIHFFNYQPIGWLIFETVAMFAIWTIAMLLLRGKPKRVTAIIGAVFSVLLIFSFTLVRHSFGGGYEVHLAPFSLFSLVNEQKNIYRSMQLNILLFMPFGMSLPFALPEKQGVKPLITVGSAVVISVAIEVCQFIFKIGMCETDDVITNTIGTAVGMLSYLLVSLILRKRGQKDRM